MRNEGGALGVLLVSVAVAGLCVTACGGSTNSATCGPGTTPLNGQCVGGGAGQGGGAGSSNTEPEAGTSSAMDSGADSSNIATQITWAGNFISTNPFGISGWIWSGNDCALATGAGLPCNQPDPALIGADQKPGWSISADAICLKGTIEAVTDWSKQWGADLGINLTADGKAPYDASKLKGFAFDITGSAPPTINIGVSMPNVPHDHVHTVQVPSTDAPAVFSGPNALAQGSSVSGVDKVPLDPSQLVFITFVPPAQMGLPTPYDFCVRNFRVLQ